MARASRNSVPAAAWQLGLEFVPQERRGEFPAKERGNTAQKSWKMRRAACAKPARQPDRPRNICPAPKTRRRSPSVVSAELVLDQLGNRLKQA
jgi:hypothetical protein